MDAQQFRAEMILRVRRFDSWAYKDQLENPSEYENYTFDDWFSLFSEYEHD